MNSPYLTVVECPGCEGKGEIGVSQDYWGNWNTCECRGCDGMGEVTAVVAEEIREMMEQER